MDNLKNDIKETKKKTRPTQRLYVPPAQRNKKKYEKNKLQPNLHTETKSKVLEANSCDIESTEAILENLSLESDLNCASSNTSQIKTTFNTIDVCANEELRDNNTENIEQSLVIMLDNIKSEEHDKNVDVDKEEMERAIVNINRKTRPLIKHVNVGNKDVLHIDIDDRDILLKKDKHKRNGSNTVNDQQVANWEDLFNEDDEINGEVTEQITDCRIGNDSRQEDSSEEEECLKRNCGPNDLDHVIELYDFPSSFKTEDLMQLYSEVNNELMYVKWCDDTHALLVLSTPNQAKRALNIQHEIIKSRGMVNASSIASQVASRVDLKPAMKRPQTNMQTARRLINSHLGTRSKLTKEEHAREREELRKAKELKKALKQSENDAWDGHPRPSTA